MSAGPSVQIYGAGRTGLAVARLARERGLTVTGIWSRRGPTPMLAALTRGLPLEVAESPAPAAAELWLLAVADDGVAELALGLAGLLDDAAPRPVAAAHCAGARPLDDLAPLRSKGIACGTWHPAMTFRGAASDAAALARAWVALEADAAALEVLEAFTAALGLRSHAVAADRRPRYHTALVLAANGRVALQGAAERLLLDAGLDAPTARRVLAPLVMRTEENLRSVGPAGALTGPVARGDAVTFRAQLEALRDRPGIHQLYRALGVIALSLVPEAERGEGHREIAELIGMETADRC